MRRRLAILFTPHQCWRAGGSHRTPGDAQREERAVDERGGGAEETCEGRCPTEDERALAFVDDLQLGLAAEPGAGAASDGDDREGVFLSEGGGEEAGGGGEEVGEGG